MAIWDSNQHQFDFGLKFEAPAADPQVTGKKQIQCSAYEIYISVNKEIKYEIQAKGKLN